MLNKLASIYFISNNLFIYKFRPLVLITFILMMDTQQTKNTTETM